MRMLMLLIAMLMAVTAGCKFGPASAVATEAGSTPAGSEVGAAEPSPEATPKRVEAANAVCADPAKPCHHRDKRFDDWELPFRMPAKLKDNKTYSSEKFFAVILKTYTLEDDCDGGEFITAVEAERKALQAANPGRKVFASYSCPNMAAVGYDFDGRYSADRERMLIENFLAVYAGPERAGAEAILKQVKARYPDAVIKQMTASFEVMNF